METITIEYQSNIKEKLIAFLNSFSKNELMIVEEKNNFELIKSRVHQSYEKLKTGESKLYDIDELDAMLEKSISENES
ncbi:MAG: hypothetical protein H7250_00660 [Flavobacterium sp.]|nr:hypothetical protein [Flavobacterium sp.]